MWWAEGTWELLLGLALSGILELSRSAAGSASSRRRGPRGENRPGMSGLPRPAPMLSPDTRPTDVEPLMTTAQDLAIVALDVEPGLPVEQGDLSLALAGAEVFDLIEAKALVLDGDRMLPSAQAPTGERLLDEAAAALMRQEPYESVEDWLWRRGRGLFSAYVEDLERVGLTSRPRGRRLPLRKGRAELVDSAARRRAKDRWTAGEPMLAALASAAGIRDEPAEDAQELAGDTVAAVLAAVGGAVQELRAVRQRRAIEDAAFDNVWRGF
jgi:Golgi phosphoprotein 3 (GPP34)